MLQSEKYFFCVCVFAIGQKKQKKQRQGMGRNLFLIYYLWNTLIQ